MAAIVFLGCSIVGTVATSGSSFLIKKSELPRFESEALLGSQEAAVALANHYEWGIGSPEPEGRAYWRRIAAENGDTSSHYNFAYHLYESSKRNDWLRGCFWVNKAIRTCQDRPRERNEDNDALDFCTMATHLRKNIERKLNRPGACQLEATPALPAGGSNRNGEP